MELKCNGCLRLLPPENFSKSKTSTRGYQYKCKLCVSDYDKTKPRLDYQKEKVSLWRKTNPEKKAEQKKRHYLKNKEKIDQKAKDWYNNNKDRSKGNAIQRKYGITTEIFNQMRESQQYRCAICGTGEDSLKKKLVIDHCHNTGKVRKLLCTNCNVAIGMFKENPRIMFLAMEYLKEFNG
jgi:hypothetical protein